MVNKNEIEFNHIFQFLKIVKFVTILFQDELKIDDDKFEEIQSLYQLYDIDRDGILNFKEYEKLLRCLGYRLNGKKNSNTSQVNSSQVKLVTASLLSYLPIA